MKTTLIFPPIKKALYLVLLIFSFVNCSKDNEDLKSDDSYNQVAEENIDDKDKDSNSDSSTDEPNSDLDNDKDGKDDDTESENDDDKSDNDTETNYTTSEAIKALELVNKARTEAGLNEIVLNNALNKAAIQHSQYMDNINEETEIGSDRSRFWNWAKDAGYQGNSRDLNLASNIQNIEDVFDFWMDDNNDRNSILNGEITDMGIGRSGNYWTQIFGVSN